MHFKNPLLECWEVIVSVVESILLHGTCLCFGWETSFTKTYYSGRASKAEKKYNYVSWWIFKWYSQAMDAIGFSQYKATVMFSRCHKKII